jgi:hypothetical protein
MNNYFDRLIEKKLEDKLKSSGAVLLAGPKFCGKTTTCMKYQKSFIKLNTKNAIEMAKLNPRGTLVGETPRLIDEWQTVPDIWNQVKDDLDFDYQFGKYILTGSSTPVDEKDIYHSGVGRIAPLKMKPLTLYESKESKGIVSLQELFSNPEKEVFDMNTEFTLHDAAYLTCRGGWPIAIQADKHLGLEITRNYYDSLFVFENSDNEKFRNKKPEVFKMILRSLARNISTEAPNTTIMDDIRSTNNRTMDSRTFEEYLKALKDLFIIEDISAWNPNIRSKTTIRTSSTRHFVDTSIACRALNISPDDLLADLRSFGLFFEDLAVRDLSVYATILNGEIRHYRDNAGLECDAVLHLENGQWAAIEIKLGGDARIAEGANSLNTLKKKIAEKSNEPLPSFMMILTACGSAYRRPDGIYVVPINCLKP